MKIYFALGFVLFLIGCSAVDVAKLPKVDDIRLPNRCLLSVGFGCVEFNIEESNVNLGLSNSYGSDMKEVSVSLVGTKDHSNCQPTEVYIGDWTNGEIKFLSFDCGFELEGKAFRGDVEIKYTLLGQTISHTAPGDLYLNI